MVLNNKNNTSIHMFALKINSFVMLLAAHIMRLHQHPLLRCDVLMSMLAPEERSLPKQEIKQHSTIPADHNLLSSFLAINAALAAM